MKKIYFVALFLLLGSLSHAEVKPMYAVYPLACGEGRANRSATAVVCINKVESSNLELLSIVKKRNGQAVESDFFLIVGVNTSKRKSSDGLLQFIVPARKTLLLEPAEIAVAEEGRGYAILNSVAFKSKEEPGDEGPVSNRKEVILEEPTIDVEEIRPGYDGLLLKTSKNFESEDAVSVTLQALAITQRL